MNTFQNAVEKFDDDNRNVNEIISIVPVDLNINKVIGIRKENGDPNEEYYKYQLINALITSGLYPIEAIGTEVRFPKGNVSSAPLKMDAAIFDDIAWFTWYRRWRTERDQNSLDWLRSHLICAIEIKKEGSTNTERVYNQQLKPAIKESEADYCIGMLYDTGRLYLFQNIDGKVIRLNDTYNLKGIESTTSDLSLQLTDSYLSIPSYNNLIERVNITNEINRTNRTIDDLGTISGVNSRILKDAMSNILRIMDKFSLLDPRGFGLLIQILALKIYDEKSNQRNPQFNLKYYIDSNERNFTSLNDPNVINFIDRLSKLFQDASIDYPSILKVGINSLDFKNEVHMKLLAEIVDQFQDYSFIRSHKTNLYQIIFYRFANEFAKGKRGQFITPIPLVDFLTKIVNPRGNETVIDPTVGIADFLSLSFVNSEPKLDDGNLYGIDNDDQMIMLAKLNMLLNGDGNTNLLHIPDKGSIVHKISTKKQAVQLIPDLHQCGNWDNWRDNTSLMKFDVVLTNPPFGENRKWEPKTSNERKLAELYELWHIARYGGWIDLGLIFLENAIRILNTNGRFGIVLSNSLASIDRWETARNWLLEKVRIVALFDLPANVFADTGVNTTIIVGYKPSPEKMEELITNDYRVFIKNIVRVGYEVKTIKRVKQYIPVYEIDENNFEVVQNNDGTPKLDEEFTETIDEFRSFCLSQESILREKFLGA